MENEKPLTAKEVEKITKQEAYAEKEDKRKHSSMHIVAFVLGLVALLGNLFWYICLPAGVIAIVFGAKSAKATASKLGKAGLILGIIGISFMVFAYTTILLIRAVYWY